MIEVALFLLGIGIALALQPSLTRWQHRLMARIQGGKQR